MTKIFKIIREYQLKVIITILISLMLSSGCSHFSTTYSDKGLSFRYPADFFVYENEEIKTEPSGLNGKLTTISLESPEQSVIIKIDLVENPLARAMFPGQYPPSDNLLRIFVALQIGNLSFSKSQVNEYAGKEAIENAEIKPISGYPAALYKAQFEDEQYGEIYLRGAVVITENRDIYINMIGISGVYETGINDTRIVDSYYIDKLWSELINTISITQPPNGVIQTQTVWQWYRNPEVGISFQYPEYMKMETNINQGGTIEWKDIYTSESNGPLAFIFISIIEEPPNEMFPERLRQSDELILSNAKARVEHLDNLLVGRSITTDSESIKDAIDSFEITIISGHKAVTYQQAITGSFWGKAYLYGTIIHTDKRSVEAIIMGVLEPSQESINKQDFRLKCSHDTMWA